MSTPVAQRNPSDLDDRTRMRARLVVVGVIVAAAIAIGVVALLSDNGASDQLVTDPPLELAVTGSDSMASCIPFDIAVLADMSPAFAATATSVEDGTVTLSVDRWYAGGDAATVLLRAPSGLEALIDGFDFEVGQRYLITAAEGTVNFCGYSGLATPEFTAAFEAAFGG